MSKFQSQCQKISEITKTSVFHGVSGVNYTDTPAGTCVITNYSAFNGINIILIQIIVIIA